MSDERIIITPEFLINLFGKYEPLELRLMILTPFMVPQEQAEQLFDSVMRWLDTMPDDPGKLLVIDGFKDVRRAYGNLTVFERENIRHRLPMLFAESVQTP